ncbi:MAG: LON peptidase substrate-binding domain-containing protein [Aquamicrobium sp.]|jgi:Lon protease-like protein|uniref:LON peptidase substrate-binding domain-containing protein n=1 Tax=Aquamicrobium sp. TaxID=1872579 RepID=UPI00349EAB98|nr:LON peptidase substrate-binding domain-containing protein [Aquamicrobium sp.]MCO5155315.1 LON peptidase substrate-binding domain-containing protein [Aquamicrobium sp.]
MQAGNARYRTEGDLPAAVAVFPLSAALLLPGGRLPLNVFEPRYLEMVDHALAGNRLIGMIQPRLDGALKANSEPELCDVGCLGRITSFAETGDGRYLISLQGVCRFRVAAEDAVKTPFRQCRITPFLADLDAEAGADEVDRAALLQAFRAYLKANELEADWESVSRAENATLVNALSMMAPYGPAEKQALLEAPDLKTRAETLIAMTEIALARESGDDFPSSLQ